MPIMPMPPPKARREKGLEASKADLEEMVVAEEISLWFAELLKELCCEAKDIEKSERRAMQ